MMRTGTFSCNNGFSLVGDSRLKCRKGAWSSTPPLCAGGNCDSSLLPEVEHARLLSYRPLKYRGSVFAYTCFPGFKKVGPGKVVCGGKSWGLGEPTVCAKKGCDETSVNAIPFGRAERKADGAVFGFQCEEGGVLEGSPLIFCDGSRWNGSAPHCMHGPERVTLTGPGSSLPGTEVEFACSSSPSNPAAGLKWEAHDAHDAASRATSLIEVGEPSEVWTGTGWETHSSAKVTIPEGGKGVVVRCTAENPRINHNVATQKIVRTHYPPDGVTVEGTSRVARGEMVSLRCISSPAFPAPSLHWMIRRNGEEEVMETDELNYQEASIDNNGGASVTSDLSFTAGTPGKLEVECYAEHETLGENKKAFSHVIEILEKSLERAGSEGGAAKRGEPAKEGTADT